MNRPGQAPTNVRRDHTENLELTSEIKIEVTVYQKEWYVEADPTT